MKAAASLSVILVAAILALGDGTFLPADNIETEMDAIKKALNQAATPSNEYLEELKDQPTRTPAKSELAYRLNVLSQAASEAQKSGGYRYGHTGAYYEGGYQSSNYHRAQTETEMDAIKKAFNQADTPSKEYLEELKDQPTRTPPKNELAYRLNVLSQAAVYSQPAEQGGYLGELKNQPTSTYNPDKIAQGDEVVFQSCVRYQYIACDRPYCHAVHFGAGLYFDKSDWVDYSAQSFQIYRMNGKGNVRVGEVIALYYPYNHDWITSNTQYLVRDNCPGNPSEAHGMADAKKWESCPGNVFKIYAKGKSVGDDILRGDDITLYHLNDKKWPSAETDKIHQKACYGTTHPPVYAKYDMCVKEVFKLLKR